jgi:hypothetical protein
MLIYLQKKGIVYCFLHVVQVLICSKVMRIEGNNLSGKFENYDK